MASKPKKPMDPTKRVAIVERMVGKRAAFHVYYSVNGHGNFDAVFEHQRLTPAKAGKQIIAMMTELGEKNIKIIRVIHCDQSVKVKPLS